MYRFVVVVTVLGLGMGAGTARAQFRLPMKLEELERRGYNTVRWKGLNLFFGGTQAARRDPATGDLSGAGDPRRGGAAVVTAD